MKPNMIRTPNQLNDQYNSIMESKAVFFSVAHMVISSLFPVGFHGFIWLLESGTVVWKATTIEKVVLTFSLGIQSYSQLMIGVSNHLRNA